jgi:hypothetical protein
MPSVQVLNRLLKHVGLVNVAPFTKDMLEGVKGFSQTYTQNHTDAEKEALALLRDHFAKSMTDFQNLMDTFFPHENFKFKLET